MDVSAEENAKVAAVTENQNHLKQQPLRGRGSANRRVVVYDREQKTVQVRNEKNIESKNIYQVVDLPARRKQITLFVDEETESRLTTRSTGSDGQSNILLAQLHLDRLSLYDQIFRLLGQLSTLYVTNAGSPSGKSPPGSC